MFTNVYIPRVPKHCFGSTISELSFVRSKIVAIEPEAITANTISAFMAINSSIETIHENAFSDNTFLNYVLIQNSWINTLHSKSVQSAIDNLTITSSRLVPLHWFTLVFLHERICNFLKEQGPLITKKAKKKHSHASSFCESVRTRDW